MKNPNYKPRIVDNLLEEHLRTFGAVCIEGPKWCGKSWTAAFHAKSAVYMGDSEKAFSNRMIAENDPSLLLVGETPRLIDEWQEVPSLWDAVRSKVDERGQKGQFILTGSATPSHKGILHSGAGRIGRLKMRPMSLWESGESSGSVSLAAICRGEDVGTLDESVPLEKLIEATVRGGWPGVQGMFARQAALLSAQYLNAIVEDDLFRLDGVRRSSAKMHLLLQSLARNESTTASNQTILRDIRAQEPAGLDERTLADYLDILKRLFVTDDIPPFASNLRSSVRIKQSPKRHFADPSLACALLKATPEKLLSDLKTFGFLFEALCERDLRIYAESFGATLYHYQDYKGREIDAVIELENGDWCAIEIKLGASQIEEAANALVKLRAQMEAERASRLPKALIVVCGLCPAAYRRADGVFVAPIAALRP